MVIKYLAVIFPFSHFTSTHPVGYHRILAYKPVGYINVVNMLLQDVIPAEPVEVIPVSHLILQLSLSRLTLTNPDSLTLPVDLLGGDLPHVPIVHELHNHPLVP